MDLSSTIRLLGDTLGRVLREQESPALFATEEEIRGLAKARRAGDSEAAARLTTEVAALSPAAARATARLTPRIALAPKRPSASAHSGSASAPSIRNRSPTRSATPSPG